MLTSTVSKYRIHLLNKKMGGFSLSEDYPLLKVLEFGGGQNGSTVWLKMALQPGKLSYITCGERWPPRRRIS